MRDFVFQAALPRVVFGAGTLRHLGREADALGLARVLVLSTPGQRALADRAAAVLGPQGAGVFAEAAMHVPVETAARAVDMARVLRADGVVAIGGGSTTGLGKAIALETSVPVIAVPTTYAGSEMTTMYGLSESGTKKTGRDPRVLPRTVIYDPELSRRLPFSTSVVSAINAIAHAAEGLYAPDANPLVDQMAEAGIRSFVAALPRLQLDPADLDARGEALVGACLCGAVMNASTVGLHHKLSHTLGGFGLPHAELHTVVLPHALAYNAPAALEAMGRIAAALGTTTAPRGLFDLARRYGAPASLAAIGMLEADLDRAADIAVKSPYPNPRPLDRSLVRELLQRAYDGAPPE